MSRTTYAIMITIILISLINACATDSLRYQIDPEISDISQIADKSAILSVSVEDSRVESVATVASNIEILPLQKDQAAILKKNIIAKLQAHNYKIISTPLLADVSLAFFIEEFEVSIDKAFFKSTVTVKSHLRLKAKMHDDAYEKLYKMTSSKEIANPANANDISGVVNHVLSKQLSEVWADPALSQKNRS